MRKGSIAASVCRLSAASAAASKSSSVFVPARTLATSRHLPVRSTHVACLSPTSTHGMPNIIVGAASFARKFSGSSVNKAAEEAEKKDEAKEEAKPEEGAAAEEGKAVDPHEMQLKEKDEIIKQKDAEIKDLKNRCAEFESAQTS